MRKPIMLLAMAIFCCFAAAVMAQEDTAADTPAAEDPQARPAAPNSRIAAQLRARMHRTMAALAEARAAEEPDQAKIEQLTKTVEGLRARLGARGPAGQCPAGGPGMGPGRGQGTAQGQCPRAGQGAGPGMSRGMGRGMGPGMGQGMGQGGGPGRGMGMGPGQGRGPMHGMGPGFGRGQGRGRGAGYGQGGGYGRAMGMGRGRGGR